MFLTMARPATSGFLRKKVIDLVSRLESTLESRVPNATEGPAAPLYPPVQPS